jgi:hypothetical protein
MRLFLLITLVFLRALEAHQGMAVLDEMYEIMVDRTPYHLKMRGGLCILDRPNYMATFPKDEFCRGTIAQWAYCAQYTHYTHFVMVKGFYSVDEESAPRNTWGGLSLARSFRSVQNTGSASRLTSFAQRSLNEQGGQQDLLSFPNHENLDQP